MRRCAQEQGMPQPLSTPQADGSVYVYDARTDPTHVRRVPTATDPQSDDNAASLDGTRSAGSPPLSPLSTSSPPPASTRRRRPQRYGHRHRLRRVPRHRPRGPPRPAVDFLDDNQPEERPGPRRIPDTPAPSNLGTPADDLLDPPDLVIPSPIVGQDDLTPSPTDAVASSEGSPGIAPIEDVPIMATSPADTGAAAAVAANEAASEAAAAALTAAAAAAVASDAAEESLDATERVQPSPADGLQGAAAIPPAVPVASLASYPGFPSFGGRPTPVGASLWADRNASVPSSFGAARAYALHVGSSPGSETGWLAIVSEADSVAVARVAGGWASKRKRAIVYDANNRAVLRLTSKRGRGPLDVRILTMRRDAGSAMTTVIPAATAASLAATAGTPNAFTSPWFANGIPRLLSSSWWAVGSSNVPAFSPVGLEGSTVAAVFFSGDRATSTSSVTSNEKDSRRKRRPAMRLVRSGDGMREWLQTAAGEELATLAYTYASPFLAAVPPFARQISVSRMFVHSGVDLAIVAAALASRLWVFSETGIGY